MRNAETVLGIIHNRGRRGLPLEDVYRQLFNPELFLLAYGRISHNAGAMTPGVTAETVDGMSLAKIGRIIDALRHERYRWAPVRRVYIEKKGSVKKRPLGDVGVHEPLRANPAVVDLVQRSVAAAGRAEAVRGRAELRLVVGLEDEAHHLLQQPAPPGPGPHPAPP